MLFIGLFILDHIVVRGSSNPLPWQWLLAVSLQGGVEPVQLTGLLEWGVIVDL
jgi:hypothetical protein